MISFKIVVILLAQTLIMKKGGKALAVFFPTRIRMRIATEIQDYKHGRGKGRRYVPRLSIYMMVRRYEGTWATYKWIVICTRYV